jgi:BirA family transcriptional regulator, biotin operon repressor / biotin---[acetyl-CoA-carboxylase] ligase
MDEAAIQNRLAGLPVPQVRYFESIGSTNDEALAWSETAPDGCLVIANQQAKGRGRFGRRWVTEPGGSLAFSLILHPSEQEQQVVGLFSALGAMAICHALEKNYGLDAQIKWPNDVLLNRRKTAGILVELRWVGERIESLIIGIGINISSGSVPPPEEVLFPATSVEDAAGMPVDRLDLLRDCLRGIFSWRAEIDQPAFLAAWEKRLAFSGEWVIIQEAVQNTSNTISGQIAGLNPMGNLLLKTSSGEVVQIVAGDVHLRLP